MYYYGYNGGYSNQMYNGYTPYNNNSFGYTGAIILVLFILLVIIFGAGFFGNQGCNQGCNN